MMTPSSPLLPRTASADSPPSRLVILYRRLTHPTGYLEHLFLLAMIVLTPLEDHLPTVGGRSVLFLLFALLALYVVLVRPWALAAIWSHPVFLAGYAWLGLAVLIESLHPHASYSEHGRIAQMLLGGVLVAALCRDKRALRMGMYGYLLAALWLTALLFLTSYGTLHELQATDFDEATQARAEVFKESTFVINLNRMAFFTAQGAVIALVMALYAQTLFWRHIYFAATAACLMGSFLPLSRSGIAIAIAACALVTLSYGISQRGAYFKSLLKSLLLIAALGGCILALAPEAVFARFSFQTTYKSGKTEGRAKVYTASLVHMPEYVVSGVGAGNFWGPWGSRSHFATARGLIGAHNSLIQVTIYWGVLSLGGLCMVLYLAWRCLPQRCGTEAASLGLLGVSVTLLLYLMATHVVSFKGFSLGLGLLVGARHWLWPQGVVSGGGLRLASLRPVPEPFPYRPDPELQ
ncbi:MAG: O-antigen ligase family protein [Candidatus Tectimicrobiota bacterium]